jgi:hypothetical protein
VDGKFIEGYGITKEYKFDPTKLVEYHQLCLKKFLTLLKKGHPQIVVDNTNTHRWEYMNYKLAAELAGYEVEIIEFIAETVEQIKVCIARNSHGTPADIIARHAMEYEPCGFDEHGILMPIEGLSR